MVVKIGIKSDISVLGDELLVEILCRLGCLKHATQCKSVCKLWHSLIGTNSYWLHHWRKMDHKKQSATLITHYKQVTERTVCTHVYNPRQTIDYCSKESPIISAKLNFLPCYMGKNPVHVLSSHKDLLLCCSNRDRSTGYYICNPFTKQWTALPPPPPLGRRPPTEEELTCINLRTKVGFVVDEHTEKFTLVRIVPYNVLPFPDLHDKTVEVSTFSSDGGWRVRDDNGPWREMFEANRSCTKVISYKGRLVCLMRKESSKQLQLCSWDLHSNYTRLPLTPVFYPTNLNYRYRDKSTIGVCEGHLRIAQLLDDHKKLIVWQFDDIQRQDWDMLHELDFSQLGKDSKDWSTTKSLYEREGRFIISTRDMAFHPYDGDILYMHVAMSSGRIGGSSNIFTCNLKKRRLELVRKLPINVWHAKLFLLVMHHWPTPVPCLRQSPVPRP